MSFLKTPQNQSKNVFVPLTNRKCLCPEFPPRSHTFVEEFLEAVGALTQDGPDLLLLKGTSSDLQGFGQRYMHLLCQSREIKQPEVAINT